MVERGTKPDMRTYIHNKIWCARPENRFGFVYHLLDILNSFRSSTSWGSWEIKGKQKFPIFRVIVCVTSSVRRGRKRSHGKIDFFGTFYEAREGATLLGYWRSKGDLTAVSLDINAGSKTFKVLHGLWKSQKKSHSILRAKRAMFTFWVDKS